MTSRLEQVVVVLVVVALMEAFVESFCVVLIEPQVVPALIKLSVLKEEEAPLMQH